MKQALLVAAAALALAGCGGGGSQPAAQRLNTDGVTLTRDPALGGKYGAPGPRSCSPTNQPGNGRPSTGQATAYAICFLEHEFGGDQLALVTHVRVEVAPRSRPYNPLTDAQTAIDPSQQLWDIRGSYTAYRCSQPAAATAGAPAANAGQNCWRGEAAHADGICYKTTFGEWRCTFRDPSYNLNNDVRSGPPAADEP